MKKLLPLTLAILGCCAGSLRAQQTSTITVYSTPPAGDVFNITSVLTSPAFGFQVIPVAKIPTGSQVGTLATQGDQNQIIAILGRGGNGNIRLRSEWNYYAPPGNEYYSNVISDPTGKYLIGSAGTPLVIDNTQPAQVLNDYSEIKITATDGYKYILYCYYAVDGEGVRYVFLFPQSFGPVYTLTVHGRQEGTPGDPPPPF